MRNPSDGAIYRSNRRGERKRTPRNINPFLFVLLIRGEKELVGTSGKQNARTKHLLIYRTFPSPLVVDRQHGFTGNYVRRITNELIDVNRVFSSLLTVLAIIFPPAAALIQVGCTLHFFLNM